MGSRGRQNEWENFSNDAEDDLREQFDHCRLYIRNIPKGLSEDGLQTVFSKYGTLVELYISKDPTKKYALVKYETPGEANLAMTKLNHTEPMKLQIDIAYKSKAKNQNNLLRDKVDRTYTHGLTAKRTNREESASVSSRISSRMDDLANGDDMDNSMPTIENEDPDVQIKNLQLELQRLQLQEQKVQLQQQLVQLEAAQKKSASFNQTAISNRCIMSDGRIVVRNVNDRCADSRDLDVDLAASAGDSRGSTCVVCGACADSFCAKCGLTPYCSVRCQRRDWGERHRAVCHNLARLAGKAGVTSPGKDAIEPTAVENETISAVSPLRRPHSPAVKAGPRKDEEPGASPVLDMTGPKKYPQNGNSANNKQPPRNFNHRLRNLNNNSPADRQDNNKRGDNRQFNKNSDRKPQKDEGQNEEDWGNKNAKTPAPGPNSAPGPSAKPAEPAPAPAKPQPIQQPAKPLPKPLASVASVTPAKKVKKLVPNNYLIDLLSPGDVALMSVECAADESRDPRPGLVCLSVHKSFESQYQDLCEVYTVDCDADNAAVTPAPGESFSYLNPSDGGWYRARRLGPTSAALLDCGKVVPLTPQDKLRALPAKYEAAPEFCCLLEAKNVKVGDNLRCKLISKTADGYKVALEEVDSGASVGEGEVSRWMPTVEYPAPFSTPAATAGQPSLPEVPRPNVTNNSKVLLVDATAFDRAFVRPNDKASQLRFDQVLQDVVLYGRSAAPLKEPPMKGQVVIGKFTDGLFYRALCKRTNVKLNKYLLEYIEFGNMEITQLESIYFCPPTLDLNTIPTEASMVTIQCTATNPFTKQAVAYLDILKDKMVDLTLTIPSGDKSAPSGANVNLIRIDTNESVNKKLQNLCTPEWKKMEEAGADVVESKALMYSDLENLELPADGCELDILDISGLLEGALSGCQSGLAHQKHVLTRLTDQMAEYCNSELGKQPYLPKHEELCIARFPPYPQWFRAVLAEQTPGSPTAQLYYVDYGNVEKVSVDLLRKMLPEFVHGQPALATHLEIKDFPKNPTQDMLARAVEYLKVNDEGRGVLTATRCERQEPGYYVVQAPGLIEAMTKTTPL